MEYIEFSTHWLYNNDTIIIKPHFNENINLVNFDDKIVSLLFTTHILINDIIESIKDIKYKSKNYQMSIFNQPLDNLPLTLQTLTFGYNFDQPVDNLPLTLQNLTFGDYFNQTVDNLPLTLQTLTFGISFNQLVDNLPYNLKNLTFGHNFNQKIDNLPHGILNLIFGHHFNQKVDNLPHGILNLTFRYHFNQTIDNLPNTLIAIFFVDNNYNFYFDKELNCLSNSIKQIKLPLNYKHEIKQIPSSLKKIICSSSYKYINELKLKKISIEYVNIMV